MNSVVYADSIRGHRLTPTQEQAIKQHAEFRRKIAERAALLPAALPPTVPHAPEPDPPPAPLAASEFYKECWFQIVGISASEKISMAQIKQAVCEHCGVSADDLVSARRQKYIILPRFIAIYLCKELTPSTLPMIGRAFGGRDHTTILSAVRKIARLLPSNPKLADAVSGIRVRLESLL